MSNSVVTIFAQLAQQLIGEVILHEKYTFPYVNNVTDWEHPELSFTFTTLQQYLRIIMV